MTHLLLFDNDNKCRSYKTQAQLLFHMVWMIIQPASYKFQLKGGRHFENYFFPSSRMLPQFLMISLEYEFTKGQDAVAYYQSNKLWLVNGSDCIYDWMWWYIVMQCARSKRVFHENLTGSWMIDKGIINLHSAFNSYETAVKCPPNK